MNMGSQESTFVTIPSRDDWHRYRDLMADAYLHSPVSTNIGHVVPRSREGWFGCVVITDRLVSMNGMESEISEVSGTRKSCPFAARYAEIS